MFLFFGGMALILNIGGKSLREYFALFMPGYLILSEDTIQVRLDKSRWYLFAGFVSLTALNLLFQNVWNINFGMAYDIFSKFLSWIGILSLNGIGRYHLNFYNKVTNYFEFTIF